MYCPNTTLWLYVFLYFSWSCYVDCLGSLKSRNLVPTTMKNTAYDANAHSHGSRNRRSADMISYGCYNCLRDEDGKPKQVRISECSQQQKKTATHALTQARSFMNNAMCMQCI
jgi:hypothetical protein